MELIDEMKLLFRIAMKIVAVICIMVAKAVNVNNKIGANSKAGIAND